MSSTGRVVGVLLAAGVGRRFDPVGLNDKLLARLGNGDTVVAAAAAALRSGLDEVIAVTRFETSAVSDLLRAQGCRVVVCADADAGMGNVLAYGVRALMAQFPDAHASVVALGDMPFIRSDTVRQVVTALGTCDLVAPYYQKLRGHPVGFGRRYFSALAGLSGDFGAKQLFSRAEGLMTAIPVDDRGVVQDIDVPADLKRSC